MSGGGSSPSGLLSGINQVEGPFQVVGGAHQIPFVGYVVLATHKKLAEAHALFDDPKYSDQETERNVVK